MKIYIRILSALLLLSTVAQGQTLTDAENLYKAYRFEEAAEMYEKIAAKLKKGRKLEEAEAIQPLLAKANQAARLLNRCEDIQIIDSIIIDKEHFLDAYFISSEAGSLQKENNQLYYTNQLQDKRYFSKKNVDNNYRLYSELKLQDTWSDQRELSLPYDSLANDNYPFMLSDGMTLYYASTGHGSIGGYDLFISRYNYGNETFFAPSQLGMPFNSPANDYMLAIDEINNIGYFATDRFQPEDKVIVYTYIPNASVQPIETEIDSVRINRAKISSIRDSWRAGGNYRAHIQQVRKYIAEEQEKAKRDFSFVINDNIVYHTLEHFDNPAARQTFQQLQEMKIQIDHLESELDSQRADFARSSTQMKTTIAERILKNENRYYDLLKRYEETAVNVRNMEIRYIRQNN